MSMTKVSELANRFRLLIGDSSLDEPEPFILNGINWGLAELPRVPKLSKLFSKHYTTTLDAKDHYKWDLNQDFRRINEIPMINFWTSTGGEPCKLNLCNLDTVAFFNKNGLPELREAGTPCEYTIEREGDANYLVLDRPSNIPIIVDYIAYGYPKPVSSMDDEIELSIVAENLLLSLLKNVYYSEAQDFNQAENILDYLDSKAIVEAEQDLYHRYKSDRPQVLGEA